MNTKVAVIMLLLIVISSTALLMESNQVYAPVHKENGFGNSTILYSNSTYIMGEIDGIYFTDIYDNGWHYSLHKTEPALNVTSDVIISDTTINTVSIIFSGNYSNVNNVYNSTYNVAVYVTGYLQDNSTTPSLIYYSEYLPFALNNKGDIEVDNTFNAGIYAINMTFQPTSYIFVTTNNTIMPSNTNIVFSPNSLHASPNYETQSLIFDYFTSSSLIKSKYYYLNITDNGNEFSINISGINYPFTKSLILLLPNGTYNYSYTLNTNTLHYIKGIVVISGKNVNLNLTYGYLPSINIQNYLYIFLVMLFMLIFARFIRGYLIGYSVIGSFFLYIGYMAGLQYFTIDTIIYIVLLLAGIITYKLVME